MYAVFRNTAQIIHKFSREGMGVHPNAAFLSSGITKWVGRAVPDDAAVNDTKAGKHCLTEPHRDLLGRQQLNRRGDFRLQVWLEALRGRDIHLNSDASGVDAVQRPEKPTDRTRGKIWHTKQDLFLRCVEVAADAVMQLITRSDDGWWRFPGRIGCGRFDCIGK